MNKIETCKESSMKLNFIYIHAYRSFIPILLLPFLMNKSSEKRSSPLCWEINIGTSRNQVIRQLVDDLYSHGIWTIVDFHQDRAETDRKACHWKLARKSISACHGGGRCVLQVPVVM